MRLFHADNSQIRCLIGSLGSGKTTAAAMEVCYYKPRYMRKTFGIVETRWCIIRNTYRELLDTTFDELKKWFPNGDWVASTMTYTLRFPRTKGCGDFVVILLLRSCDKPEHMKKFKSMNLTGYWMDESIEINEDIKKMVRGRLGRFPRNCPVRYGVETSNPCDIEHPTYWMFKWARNFEPPGPLPSKPAVGGFVGWWQKPRENVANLRPGYYEDLAREYAVTPEWVEMFVEGKPGMPLKGRLVYANFKRDIHVAFDPLVWMHSPDEFGRERGVSLYVGWDNTGNFPAAVVVQIVGPLRAQVLREYWSEREGIVDFAKRVKQEMEREFPGYQAKHYCDPAAFSQFSRSGVQGGLTSNAELMREETGISCIPSEQNPIARQSAVDQMLARRDGVLIDRSCTRLITGFTSSYVFQEVYGAMAGEFKRQPWKNKFSHCQDALQYVFVKLFPPILRNKIGSDPYAGYKKDYMIPSDYESEEAEIDWDAKRF
jgi:hypothetical protein